MPLRLPVSILLAASFVLVSTVSQAQHQEHLKLDSPFASFVEPDFPFFSHALDARELGPNWPADNLTPRGIILPLGDGAFACFDTDLLRVALIWRENSQGEYLTMVSMASGSYRLPNRKAPAGQNELPKPLGDPILANGIYPGWSVGSADPVFTDDRDRGSADPGEVGLGPLPSGIGQWRGLEVKADHVILRYRIGDAEIRERIGVEKGGTVCRYLTVAPHRKPLTVVNGQTGGVNEATWRVISPAEKTITWRLEVESAEFSEAEAADQLISPISVENRISWQDHPVVTQATLTPQTSGFVHDEIAPPVPNPWKRNVRLTGFDFFSDGRAAFCAFDGDIWLVSGLGRELQNIEWRRFASGLHEPMGLAITGDQIYVTDRNGIIRLQDTDGDRVADHYENFCNLVPQTAETREFAMDIFAKPGGGFYIAKGGQVAGTRGQNNGTVIEISPDGKSFDLVATGLRQPFLGVDPATGAVTASDQQGNWKPATPIYAIEKGSYYGFQPARFKDKAVHPAPITPPALWIPHFVNQSGASQLWLHHADLGSLEAALLHIGFNRPEVFKVFLDDSGAQTQGAVVSVHHGFSTGLLAGRVHPIDGSVFLTGMKIWGTVAKEISGLYRLRFAGGPNPIPEKIRSFKEGVLLRFTEELDPGIAGSPASYSADRWNYLQTYHYGSGHYKLSGEPGQETIPIANVYLSRDRKAVFLAIPDMRPVHSLRVSYRLAIPTVQPTVQHAFLTVHSLQEMDLRENGFENAEIDLTLKAGAGGQPQEPDPSVEIGRQVHTQFGCLACHTVDGTSAGGVPLGDTADTQEQSNIVVGPTWLGLWGAKREFSDGTVLKRVDEVYLRESIIDPGRLVPQGFEITRTGVGMPSYLGVLKDYQIDSVILYIKSLAKMGR